MRHKIPVQLRFNDIDILGHLNNVVYFSLYDLGKAKYMEEVGLRTEPSAPPTCVIADVHCQYVKPVHFGDEIFISTSCTEIGEKHFVLQQEMTDASGDVRSLCRTVMVSIDPATGKASPLTPEYRSKIDNYEKEVNLEA